MRDVRQPAKYLLAGAAFASLAACTVHPNLVGAHVKKGTDKTEIVEVILLAADAKTIRNREIYFSIVVVDCNNRENRFPIKPYIAGKPASDFKFPIAGEFVTAQGTIPERFLLDFQKACVVLQGGSYIFGKLDSTPVPLVRLAMQGAF